MSYFAYDRMGSTVPSPDANQRRRLLDSLGREDPEHPDVSLTHESGWSISAFPSGLIVFENVETGEGPWHMRSVPAARTLELWDALAVGKHVELVSLPWVDGHGT